MNPECPNCQSLRQENKRLLKQLDEALSALEPLRLQVQALEACRKAQIAWAGEARLALIALTQTLEETVPTQAVTKALASSRSVIR